MMEAVILAGGLGSRLRTAVPNIPKPMAPIQGRPFLEILLGSLAGKGFRRTVLSLGYMAETISSHFGASFARMDLAYVVEDSPLGTGGAVRLAMTECSVDHVFVFNGDTYVDLDVESVEQLWQAKHRTILVGQRVEDSGRYGRLLVSKGHLCGFSEKGVAGPGIINAGCYVIGTKQLDGWPLNTPFSLEVDYLTPSIAAEQVELFQTSGLFIDIGVPEDFTRAQTILADVARVQQEQHSTT